MPLLDVEDEKPGTSNNYPNPEKTPAKEPDFYDLPDNLSDNEEQNQGQAQRSGTWYNSPCAVYLTFSAANRLSLLEGGGCNVYF